MGYIATWWFLLCISVSLSDDSNAQANLEFVIFLTRSLSAGITGMYHNEQFCCALPGVCTRCLWVGVHMCADVRGGQSAVLGVSRIYSPSFLWQRLSLTCAVVIGLDWLTGNLQGLILLSPPLQYRDYRHKPPHSAFILVLGIKLRSSCLRGKHSTDWATSLAQLLTNSEQSQESS